jgi:hypothetical protein
VEIADLSFIYPILQIDINSWACVKNIYVPSRINKYKQTNKQTKERKTERGLEYLVRLDFYFKTLTRNMGGRAA